MRVNAALDGSASNLTWVKNIELAYNMLDDDNYDYDELRKTHTKTVAQEDAAEFG